MSPPYPLEPSVGGPHTYNPPRDSILMGVSIHISKPPYMDYQNLWFKAPSALHMLVLQLSEVRHQKLSAGVFAPPRSE